MLDLNFSEKLEKNQNPISFLIKKWNIKLDGGGGDLPFFCLYLEYARTCTRPRTLSSLHWTKNQFRVP